jgi:hypothetical protein
VVRAAGNLWTALQASRRLGITNTSRPGKRGGLRVSGIARRRTEPGWRAAVLERADTLFVCEGVRKAAAHERQPQRAERAMHEGVSGGVLSSARDDDGGGFSMFAPPIRRRR